MTDHKDLNRSINELKALTDAIHRLEESNDYFAKKDQELSIKKLNEATELSKIVFMRINDVLSGTKQLNMSEEFFDELITIVTELNGIAHNKIAKAPQPYKMIDRLTTSLETFLNSCLSPDHQDHAAWVADKIPGVDLVVLCCKTIPYYWPHTTRLEKAGTILAIGLMVASIALITISMIGATLPILPLIATLLGVVGILCKYGKDLYKHVIAKSEARYKRLEQTKELSKQLDKQLQLVEDRIEELFPNRNVDWNTAKSTPKPQLIRPYHIKHVQEGFALLYMQEPSKNLFKHWER